MSRHVIILTQPIMVVSQGTGELPAKEQVEITSIAYGLDHAVGWFLQLWSEDRLVDDFDCFVRFSRSKFLEKIKELNLPIPQAHLDSIALDLPV